MRSIRALAEELDIFYGDFAIALDEAEHKWTGSGSHFDSFLTRADLMCETAFLLADEVECEDVEFDDEEEDEE